MSAATTVAVKSATRTLDVLELLAAQVRPMAASEIAATLGIPVSSLAYLLGTLVERGYLARSGRQYSLGPALLELLPGSGPSLARRAMPYVRSIRRELNETTGFFERRGWEMEALVSEVGEQALRYSMSVGTLQPLHAFSAGKALLATLPEDAFEDYLRGSERVAFTPRTKVAADVLRADIAEARSVGFAYARDEFTLGIVGMGRAVWAGDAVLGAFSVAIPQARFTPALEARVRGLLARAEALLAAGYASGD